MTTGRINQVVTKPTRPCRTASQKLRRWRCKVGWQVKQNPLSWTLSIQIPEGNEFSMPSLQLWLRNGLDARCSIEATVRLNPFPPRQSVGIPTGSTVGIRPSTRNLRLFPSNCTHWVTHNQVSLPLADAPRGRKGWTDTSRGPSFARRPNWTEWEVKAQVSVQAGERKDQGPSKDP